MGTVGSEKTAGFSAVSRFELAEPKLENEQLLKNQPAAGGVQSRLRLRQMDIPNRLSQLLQLIGSAELLRQRIVDAFRQEGEGLPHRRFNLTGGEALGLSIYRMKAELSAEVVKLGEVISRLVKVPPTFP